MRPSSEIWQGPCYKTGRVDSRGDVPPSLLLSVSLTHLPPYHTTRAAAMGPTRSSRAARSLSASPHVAVGGSRSQGEGSVGYVRSAGRHSRRRVRGPRHRAPRRQRDSASPSKRFCISSPDFICGHMLRSPILRLFRVLAIFGEGEPDLMFFFLGA